MKDLYSGLTQYVATAYNTLASTTVLTVGGNIFAGSFPESPDLVVGILPDGGVHDPHAVTHHKQFDLAVRAPKHNDGLAATVISSIVSLLDGKTNVSTLSPGMIRAVEEPARGGYDAQKRMVLITKFIIWTTKR